MTYSIKNRDTANTVASALANGADIIELDVINATDEGDLMAVLSHIEIVVWSANKLRDVLRASLEDREYEEAV